MPFRPPQACRIMLRRCYASNLKAPYRSPSASLLSPSPALLRENILIFRNADQLHLSVRAPAQFCLDGRHFSSTTTQEPASLFPGPQYGTIISRLPLETAVDEIVSRIKPFDVTLHKRSATNLLAVFLLTPTFSRWLLDDGVFLRKALHRAFAKPLVNTNGEFEVQALVAVVDCLPIPSKGVQSTLRHVASGRTRNIFARYEGLEGLSYAFLNGSCRAGAPQQERVSGEVGVPSKGSHIIGVHMRATRPSSRTKSSPDRWYDVRIPLANTIFQTGHDATMFTSRWTIRSGRTGFEMKEKSFHERLSFEWPTHVSDAAALAIPLIPLTVPRQIHSGMGNIIRQTIDASGTTVPASQELEKSIDNYFGALKMPQWGIPVWAMILSSDSANVMVQTLENSGSIRPQGLAGYNIWTSAKWKNIIDVLLEQGCKLHRVQGGGGGWGKKAGLLSLDPESFENDGAWTYPDHGIMPTPLDENFIAKLDGVAKSGDFIQFFTTPANLENIEQLEAAQTESPLGREHLAFGTMPNSMDVIPSDAVQSDPPAEKIIVCENYFGALSETSISLRGVTESVDTNNSTNIPFEGQLEFMRTKIDVPHSRFSLYQGPSSRNPDDRMKIDFKKVLAKRLKKHRFRKIFPAGQNNKTIKVRRVLSNVKRERESGVFIRRVYKIVQRDEYQEDSEKAWKRMMAMQWNAKSKGASTKPSSATARAGSQTAWHDSAVRNELSDLESRPESTKHLEGPAVKRVVSTSQKLADSVEALLKGF